MKPLVLFTLLMAPWAWGAPVSPPDFPGSGVGLAERAKILLRLAAEARSRGDASALLEIECLRLEPLLKTYDPTCPARLRALEQQAAELPPGPTRARYYWTQSLYARQMGENARCNSFARMAVQEPGVPDLWKAEWLSQMPGADDTHSQVNLYESRLRHLTLKDPAPPVRWHLLTLQAELARLREQPDLGDSLLKARLHLAQQQHWGREEMQAWLALYELHESNRTDWDHALSVASRLGRDEWTQELFRSCPTQADWQRVWRALRRKPSPIEDDRYWLSWKRRPSFSDVDKRLAACRNLVDDAHRRGDLEEELTRRLELFYYLRDDAKRVRESQRELEATVQIRLDHPPVEPDWVPVNTSLGGLSSLLEEELTYNGHQHQAQALIERALGEHWARAPETQMRLLRSAVRKAEHFEDQASLDNSLKEARGLVSQLPIDRQVDSLIRLASFASDEEKPEYLSLAEQIVGNQMGTYAFSQGRRRALGALTSLTYGKFGQSAQADQFWRNEWERAKNLGDTVAAGLAAKELLFGYRFRDQPEEFKALAIPLLADPDTSSSLRRSCLFGCELLARHSDPLALDWAEQLQRLAASNDRVEKIFTLVAKANVLRQFRRFQAALECLDQADRVESAEPDHEFSRAQETRVRILWESGRRDESLGLLQRFIDAQYATENQASSFDGALVMRVNYLRELKLDWQGELEKRLLQLEALGEVGEDARDNLLAHGLGLLAKQQDWDTGRSLLARHPWRQGPLSYHTKKLRAYPPWSDLFPRSSQPPRGANQPASLQQLVDELRLNQPQLGQLLSLRSTNLKHLRAHLQPKDTLVTYCFQGDQLYLLALRKDGGFYRQQRMSIGDLQDINRRYLQSLYSDQTSEAETSLFGMLLEPVLSDDNEQRLFLVPNGPLWQVPFGALRDPQGRATASRAQIVMMGSGDLLRLADGDWQPYRLTHPLAIGAPPAADLPGAYQELGQVAQLLPECQLRRGDQATLAALYQRDKHWGLLHFASHAHYRPDRPLDSDIQLHDGTLQLKQLSQLSLADHALVALSVCQGGASKGQQLDEPVTLATGFSAAGADTVVANLWPVEDEVARLFFTAFYKDLAAGATPSDSFRQAQQACRRSFPKACDWGGFFLLGNPD